MLFCLFLLLLFEVSGFFFFLVVLLFYMAYLPWDVVVKSFNMQQFLSLSGKHLQKSIHEACSTLDISEWMSAVLFSVLRLWRGLSAARSPSDTDLWAKDHCDRWLYQPSSSQPPSAGCQSQMRAEGPPVFFTEFLFLVPFRGGSPHSLSEPHNTAPCPKGWCPPLGCSYWWFPRAVGTHTGLPPYCGPHRCGSQPQACASPQGCRSGKRFWRCLGVEAAERRGSTSCLSLCWGYCCRYDGIPLRCSSLASSASTSSGSRTEPAERTEMKVIDAMTREKSGADRSALSCKWGDLLLCWQSSTRWPPGDPAETTNSESVQVNCNIHSQHENAMFEAIKRCSIVHTSVNGAVLRSLLYNQATESKHTLKIITESLMAVYLWL